jgi:hypothetical protein
MEVVSGGMDDQSSANFETVVSRGLNKSPVTVGQPDEACNDGDKSCPHTTTAVEKPNREPDFLIGSRTSSVADDSPQHSVSSCEIFPRLLFVSSTGSSSGSLLLRNGISIPVDRWIEEKSYLPGKRCLVFETGPTETDGDLETRAGETFRNQFVLWKSDQGYLIPYLSELASLLSLWMSLDKDRHLAVIDCSSVHVVWLGTCLVACDSSLSTDDAVQLLCSKFEKLRITKGDKRYMEYMSKLLRSAGTFRPRPILIKQLLIESCFCPDTDLEVVISDSNNTESVNEHVVQFYDDESHAIAMHFPNFKSRLFQGDVCVQLRSRRRSTNLCLVYRFNTAFVDNLTSSTIHVPLVEWDPLVPDEVVFPKNFTAQLITAPATNATANPIVVPPYSISRNLEEQKTLFLSKHIVKVNEKSLNHFIGNRSPWDLTDISVCLKLAENNVIEAGELLHQLFSQQGPRKHRFSQPLVGLKGDSPLVSGSPAEPNVPPPSSISKSSIEQALEDSASIRSYLSQYSQQRSSRRPSVEAESLDVFKSPITDRSPEPQIVLPPQYEEAVDILTKFTEMKFSPPQGVCEKRYMADDLMDKDVDANKEMETLRSHVKLEDEEHSTMETGSKKGNLHESGDKEIYSIPTNSSSAKAVDQRINVKSPPPPLPGKSNPKSPPPPLPSKSNPKSPPPPLPGKSNPKSPPPSLPGHSNSKSPPPALPSKAIIGANPNSTPMPPNTFASGTFIGENVFIVNGQDSLQGQPVIVGQNAIQFSSAVQGNIASGPINPPFTPIMGVKGSGPPLPGQGGPIFLGKISNSPPPPPMEFRKAVPAIPTGAPVPSLPLRKAPPTTSSSEKTASSEANAAETEAKPLPLGRKLHWKPLRNVESTIWATLDGSGIADDFSGLKSVFENNDSGENNNGKAKSVPAGPAGNPSNHVVTLFEGKRAQNIGVVVARVPLEIMTAKLAVLELDSLSVENLERLKMILPTEDEAKIFSQFNGDVSSLRDIEQKVISLFRLPRLSQRIRFCLVSLQLPGTLSELQEEISLLRKCGLEIRNSGKLKKVLQFVLLLGNYVNRGETRGFSIESLGKLMEFKSASDPGITTLHFLAARLLSTDPSLVDLFSEMPTLRLVSKITPEAITQGVTMARNDPESIKNEIKSQASLYTDEALGRMQAFVSSIEPRIQGLVADWSACEKELSELRKFFGEDPKKLSVEDFFGHLRNFFDSLANACAEIKKRPKKFEKILQASPINSGKTSANNSPKASSSVVPKNWGKVTTEDLVKASENLKIPTAVKVAKSIESSGPWRSIERPQSPSEVQLRSTSTSPQP